MPRFVWATVLWILLPGGRLPAQDAKPPAVIIVQPLERESADYDFPGRLGPSESVEVRAPVSGFVEQVHVPSGAAVKKGDLLVQIADGPYRAGLKKAEQQLQYDEQELRRSQRAWEKAQHFVRKYKAEELAGPIDAQLEETRKALDKVGPPLAAALAREPFSPRRDALKNLQDKLKEAQRKSRAAKPGNLDIACELELSRLANLIEALTAPVRNNPAQLEGELVRLREAIYELVTLSRARTREGLDTLVAERDVAAARIVTAKTAVDAARRDLEATQVRAPAAGRAAGAIVKPGERVSAGSRSATLLVTLVRTDPARVAFTMDERTYLHLCKRAKDAKAPRAVVPVLLGLQGDKGFAHRGILADVDTRVDPKTGRIRALADFPNAAGALTADVLADDERKRGVRIRLSVGEPRKVLLIPPFAVIADAAGKTYLGMVNDQNVVEARTVKLGPLLNGLQVIAEGIKSSDWIIVDVQRNKRNLADTNLSPEDFVQDLRMQGIKPGTTVSPVKTVLPMSRRDKEE